MALSQILHTAIVLSATSIAHGAPVPPALAQTTEEGLKAAGQGLVNILATLGSRPLPPSRCRPARPALPELATSSKSFSQSSSRC